MKSFATILVALIISLPGTSFASFSFPTWLIEETDKQVAALKKENASLNPSAVQLAEKRAKASQDKKDFAAAASEYARLAGKFPEKYQYWVELSFAQSQTLYQQAGNDENSSHLAQEAKIAAIRAYEIAKTPEEKAIALLLYGDLLEPDSQYESPSYTEIYLEARSLTDMAALKKSHPRFADLMAFQYLKTRINNQNTPPSACFAFSHPLDQKGINYADYVTVSPKTDIVIRPYGLELCASPVAFGGTYDVTFKKGLMDSFGEKLKNDEKISFKVKDQDSRLSFSNNAYVLMQNEKTHVPLVSVNVDTVNITVLKVGARNLTQLFGAYSTFLSNQYSYNISQIQTYTGEKLYEGKMDLVLDKNKTSVTQFPFSDVIKTTDPGVYIIQAEEAGTVFGNRANATQWLIVSDIGLTVFFDEEGGMTINARSLKTADPLSSLDIQLLAYNNTILGTVKTNRQGIAYFDPTKTRGVDGNRPALVLAQSSKNDFSFLSLQQPAFDLSDRGASGRQVNSKFDAFLYTEQGVYRPGESVHLNTFLRDDKANAKANIPLVFKVMRPDGVETMRIALTGNPVGFYTLTLPLPLAARTGQWTVFVYVDPEKDPIGQLQFSVEDFVPSRMTVVLKANTLESFLSLEKPLDIDVTGRYLFGAPAAGLSGDAVMILRTNPRPYPNYPGYVFGRATEQFLETRNNLPFVPLNDKGEETLSVALHSLPQTSKPIEALVRVTLADIGGRPEIGTLKVPVQVTPNMLGIKSMFADGTLKENEDTAEFEIISLDAAGKLTQSEDVEYTLFEERLHYNWYQAQSSAAWTYQSVIEDRFLDKGNFKTSQIGPVTAKVSVKDWGRYRLEVRDLKTNAATSIQFQKGWTENLSGTDTPDKLKVLLSKDKFNVGDNAEILIEAPFEGQALVTVASNKILSTQNIDVTPKGTKLKLKVTEDWGVGVYCMVSAFRPLGKTKDDKPFLPKRAVGLAWVEVDTSKRQLKVDFTLPSEAKPRETITIPLQIQASEGGIVPDKTVLTFAAVDEGILKLTDFVSPNPAAYFFGKRRLSVELRDLYGKLIEPKRGPIGELRVGGDAGILSRNRQGLSKRAFRVVSLYQGVVDLDKTGKANVSFMIPDFNGSLRLMAVAMDEKRLGQGEASLLVRDKIVLEAVLPRFLAKEDSSSLSFSLHNVSGEEGTYILDVKVEGSISLKDKEHIEIPLKKEGVFESSLAIKASTLGDGKVTLHLRGPKLDITRVFELSVREVTPPLQRSVSTRLAAGESQSLTPTLLHGLIPETIQAQIMWSSKLPWDTQAIADRLFEYRYGCVEQTVSKAMGALVSHKPTAKDLVNQSLAYLSEKQQSSGAFDLWGQQTTGNIWLTAYVVDFMQRAAELHYEIPRFVFERALDWLSNAIQSPSETPESLSSAAYGLYVLTIANRVETGSLRYFYDSYYDTLDTPMARGLIGAALALKGEQDRALHAFTNSTDVNNEMTEGLLYGTALRDRAATLSLMQTAVIATPALASINKNIENLRSLITDNLLEGRELSTQEMAWLLLASASFNPSATNAPISVQMDDQTFNAAESSLLKSLSVLQLQKGLSLKNMGSDALWQHVSVLGIPDTVPPMVDDHDLKVTRQYFTMDNKPVSPETVAQGTQLQVLIEGSALSEGPRQLLLVDLLPAGFELENTRLDPGTDNKLPTKTAVYTESRDDRFIAAFTLDEKVRDFKVGYVVRAVTPGHYTHPGLFVEDMYAPWYFARTEASQVGVVSGH